MREWYHETPLSALIPQPCVDDIPIAYPRISPGSPTRAGGYIFTEGTGDAGLGKERDIRK